MADPMADLDRREMALTKQEAIERLNAIAEKHSGDPEVAHSEADEVLLAYADSEVAGAYDRVVRAVGSWWYA